MSNLFRDEGSLVNAPASLVFIVFRSSEMVVDGREGMWMRLWMTSSFSDEKVFVYRYGRLRHKPRDISAVFLKFVLAEVSSIVTFVAIMTEHTCAEHCKETGRFLEESSHSGEGMRHL